MTRKCGLICERIAAFWADVTVEEIKGFSDFQILVEDVEILTEFIIMCLFWCICEWEGFIRDNLVPLKLDLAEWA
jgi:hypothetical protein